MAGENTTEVTLDAATRSDQAVDNSREDAPTAEDGMEREQPRKSRFRRSLRPPGYLRDYDTS